MQPVLFILALHALGSQTALLVLRGRHVPFALASGLLWGLALHAACGLLLVLARQGLGVAPVYPVWLVGLLLGGGALGTGAAVWLRAGHWGRSAPRIAAAQACALVVVAGASALALHFDLAFFTSDSFRYLELGLSQARVADPAWIPSPTFWRTWSAGGSLLHAATDVAGVEVLYFVPPLIGASLLATLAVTAHAALRIHGVSRRAGCATVALGLACLLSSQFFDFQLFYVHVNLLASGFVLLFFTTAWMGLVREEPGWFVLAGAALFVFSVHRVEAPIFAAIFLGLLWLEPGGPPRSARLAIAVTLPPVLWCGVLGLVLADTSGYVTRPRALVMAGLLGASLLPAWLASHRAWRGRASRLRGPVLAGAALVVAVLAASHPWMRQRLLFLASNVLLDGHWGSAWALVGALLLAAPLLARVRHEGFVLLGLAGFGLGVAALGYFGGWSRGPWSSANRMSLHVLPTAAWILMLKVGALASSSPGGRRPRPRAPRNSYPVNDRGGRMPGSAREASLSAVHHGTGSHQQRRQRQHARRAERGHLHREQRGPAWIHDLAVDSRVVAQRAGGGAWWLAVQRVPSQPAS